MKNERLVVLVSEPEKSKPKFFSAAVKRCLSPASLPIFGLERVKVEKEVGGFDVNKHLMFCINVKMIFLQKGPFLRRSELEQDFDEVLCCSR